LPASIPADLKAVVTYGSDKGAKNPLDLVDTDRLVSDIESKIALVKGRL